MKRESVNGGFCVKVSPPARGRGLKPAIDCATDDDCLSPPARGRGLKLTVCIERLTPVGCRPLRGGVD